MAGEELLQLGVQLARAPPLLGEVGLGFPGHEDGDERGHRDGDQRDQGQDRRQPQHHGQRPGEHQQRHDQLVEQLVEGLGDVVDVVRGAAQHVPAVLFVKMAGRQDMQFLLHRGPQPVASRCTATAVRAPWIQLKTEAPRYMTDTPASSAASSSWLKEPADHTVNHDVGGVAQEFRCRHVEHHKGARGGDDTGHPPRRGPQQSEQPPGGPPAEPAARRCLLLGHRPGGPRCGRRRVCPPGAGPWRRGRRGRPCRRRAPVPGSQGLLQHQLGGGDLPVARRRCPSAGGGSPAPPAGRPQEPGSARRPRSWRPVRRRSGRWPCGAAAPIASRSR